MTISQLLEKRNTTNISMNILSTDVNNKIFSRCGLWKDNFDCSYDCDFNCDCGGDYYSAYCDRD